MNNQDAYRLLVVLIAWIRAKKQRRVIAAGYSLVGYSVYYCVNPVTLKSWQDMGFVSKDTL